MNWKDLFNPKKINEALERPAPKIFRLVKDSDNPDGVVWSDDNLRKVGLDPEQFPKVNEPSEKQIIKAAELMIEAKGRSK